MNKKLSILLATITSAFVLAACSSQQVTSGGTSPQETSQESAQETASKLNPVGTWEDEVSKRASMDVTPNADGSFRFLIHWGGSATESAIWEINGTLDETSGTLVYEDGKYTIHTFDEEDKETVSEEETTKGSLTLENGKLRWKDSKLSEDSLFSQVQE